MIKIYMGWSHHEERSRAPTIRCERKLQGILREDMKNKKNWMEVKRQYLA